MKSFRYVGKYFSCPAKKNHLWRAAVLILLFLSGCVGRQQVPQVFPPANREARLPEIVTFDVSRLPATYMGTLSSEECTELTFHINIMPDHTYSMKRSCRVKEGEPPEEVVDSGMWQLAGNGTRLELFTSGVKLSVFRVIDDKCLEPDNGDTAPAASAPAASGDLKRPETTGPDKGICRQPGVIPFESARQMQGLYSCMADVGIFRDCETGKRYRVLQDGDNAALESAYLNAEHGIAEPLVVKVQGVVKTVPAVEGKRLERVLLVERFVAITPHKSCRSDSFVSATDSRVSAPRIENIKWELVELAGEQIEPVNGVLPGFRLNPQGMSMRGFGGCNRMMGMYELHEDRLNFSNIATTRRFCQATQGLEDRLVQALEHVRTYRLEGNLLKLYGDYGLLAVFKNSGDGAGI